jgi:hypothetical protein
VIRQLYPYYQAKVLVLIYNSRLEVYVFGKLDEIKYLAHIFDYNHDLESKNLAVKYNKVKDLWGGENYKLFKMKRVDVVMDQRAGKH